MEKGSKAKEFLKKNFVLIFVIAVLSGLISLSSNSIFGKIDLTKKQSAINEKEIIIIKEKLKQIQKEGKDERKVIIKKIEEFSIDFGSTDSIIRQHDREIAELKTRVNYLEK